MLRRSLLGVGGVACALWLATAAAACGSDDTAPPDSPVCGDGTVDDGEQCDDGNTSDGDGCSKTCTTETPAGVCGDGKVDAGEECDDGNTADGDGCSQTCTTEASESCGDGKIDPGEECDDGNAVPGDGCEVNCKNSPSETVCAKLPPLAAGTCEVTAGDAEGTLLIGDVLLPTTVLKGGQVLVDAAGNIACVGCDCSAKAAGVAKVTCPEAVISPSLINSHDHVTFQASPGLDSGERYEHRHEWRQGKNGHTKLPAGPTAGKALVQYSELRHLMAGATSTIGSGGTLGVLRNLDRSDDLQELLGQTKVYYQTFPLGDSDGKMLTSGCGYTYKDTTESIAMEEAYYPHVSEGISAAARNEFVCATSTDNGGQDLAQPQSAFIHSVGLNPNDYALMAAEKVSLIWSPRSNVRLYGDTAQVTTAARLGVPIALGTDWLQSGSMNMLRELRCADDLNKKYYDNYFSDRDLWRMVTEWAAKASATDDVIGVLDEGKVADIAIFSAKKNPGYRAVVAAEVEDVVLVMRGGKVLYGDDAVVTGLGATGCDSVDVCGSAKKACIADEFLVDLAGLQASVGPDAYPLFFCGGATVTNEPSCEPARSKGVNGSTVYTGVASATDADGDGVEDPSDNCPKVFNPIRPMDDGVQGDFDGDGQGDPCDICPLEPGKSDCAPPQPDDLDGDGVLDTNDNCAGVKNPDQADEDKDGKGDACDACPSTPNAGSLACPVSIYDVKKGVVMPGSKIGIAGALVTACADGKGYFVQTVSGDPGFAGVEDSAIYVYDPKVACGMTVSAGDRVDLNPATVSVFKNQTQLGGATATKLSSGNALPPPVLLSPADAATKMAYEAQLVRVENVSVTDVSVKPNVEVTGPVTIVPFFFQPAYYPVLDETYKSAVGMLTVFDVEMRLAPRTEADLELGPPVLVSLEPSPTFATKGAVGAETFPKPLIVTLSRPYVADTVVDLASSDVAVVALGGLATSKLTVPAGTTTVKVLLDAPMLGTATVTASLNGAMKAASVKVIDDSLVRSVVSVTPSMAMVPPGGAIDLTVSLDLPAPSVGGSTVALSLAPGMFGMAPSTVVVPANALSATVKFTASGTLGVETLTATLGASMATANLEVKVLSGLVVNEVDYDNVGTDTAEYVEIYNGTGAPFDLKGFALVLVNGSTSAEYKRQDLSSLGVLPADSYVVIGSTAAIALAPMGTKTLSLGAGQDYVQNGAPDAVGIIDTTKLVLVDAFSYEGSVTMATLQGFAAPVSFVEGTPLPNAVADSNTVLGSLCRIPNGIDFNDAAKDWRVCKTLTPGAANVE